MITLAGITLPKDLLWSDQYSWRPIAQATKVTLGGLTIPFSTTLLNGRPITLVATENTGWIPQATVDLLVALSENLNGVYTLTIHNYFSGSVIFRHSDAPALDLSYLVSGEEPSDWLIGSIKLLTI